MDFDLSQAEQEMLLQRHLDGFKPGGEKEVKSASDYIKATSETLQYN